MHKLLRAAVVVALVVVVSVRETESSQRVVDHYERKLNKLQKKINAGKPVIINGKIKRYKCVEEYVAVDEYGNVAEPGSELKSTALYSKPLNVTATTFAPKKALIHKDSKKLSIQHLPSKDSVGVTTLSSRSAHQKVMSILEKSAEQVEKISSSVEDDDDRVGGKRRKESIGRRFGMNRLASRSDEEEQYDEQYDDDYYVEERPILRRGRARGIPYRRRGAPYYMPFERRMPMRRAYAGNFIDEVRNYTEKRNIKESYGSHMLLTSA
ncbi:hypothetical protein L596_006357 [Steinernema carpocapsae]|uniref:Uncharacterized protein n=1 Tax=Steinernema carpocapsae TaxID=34508 RepID=A0A4U8V1X5_STECR|nr:hypothetical protein L596_006357 [Steinernema carpocapsae]